MVGCIPPTTIIAQVHRPRTVVAAGFAAGTQVITHYRLAGMFVFVGPGRDQSKMNGCLVPQMNKTTINQRNNAMVVTTAAADQDIRDSLTSRK
jgi:hypothetical protein